jgi:hypothetical protein
MRTKVAILLLPLAFIISAHAQVLPNDAVVDGKTIGDWSAEWWKWLLPIPVAQNPARDTNGSFANVAQPDGPVFFLAKGYNWNVRGTRTFTVPEDKYLFVPLLSNFQDNIDVSPPLTVEQLHDAAKASIDLVNELHATIDGVPVPDLFSHRAVSLVFSIDFLSPDNLVSDGLGHPFTGLDDPIVSDGYYLMIEPLSLGTHVINFGGSVGPPVNLSQDMTAFITVIPIPLPQRVERLITSVRGSNLPTRSQQSLLATLDSATVLFTSGHLRPGINQARAFQNKVRAQLTRNDQPLADELISAAQRIIDKAELQLH